MNRFELEAAEEKQRINRAVEAARQEKKTIKGHCEICNAWAVLHPVREADPACPGDTAVVTKCIECLPARPIRQHLTGGPESRRD